MKTLHLLLTAAVVLSSCSLVEDDISLGYPHIYGHRNNTRTGEPLKKDSTATDTPAGPRPDTLLYLSAVRVPADYDWQKDSAYGAVDAEIVLLCNFHEILRIPVGPHVSAAADRHHIVGGHICTEFQASSRTYIGIDGKDVVTLEGRHELMGVLEHEGVLYTLTKPLEGSGFRLMADGQTVLTKNSGQLYGSMAEPSYMPGGALYLDNGKPCFCFSEGTSAYKVVDGVETMVSSKAVDVQDLRIIRGKAVSANLSNGGFTWQESRLWPMEAGAAVSGIVLGSPAVMRPGGSARTLRGSPESTLYVDDRHEFALYCSRNGTVKISDTAGERTLDGNWYFFSTACACLGPEGPAVALTPMGSAGKPAVVYNGQNTAVNLNGFLTGITITIKDN